jgi:hypothetical protein
MQESCAKFPSSTTSFPNVRGTKPGGTIATTVRILKFERKKRKQAGAELCQAQGQFGLAWFGLHRLICLHT